jgi:hypothetical protein
LLRLAWTRLLPHGLRTAGTASAIGFGLCTLACRPRLASRFRPRWLRSGLALRLALLATLAAGLGFAELVLKFLVLLQNLVDRLAVVGLSLGALARRAVA